MVALATTSLLTLSILLLLSGLVSSEVSSWFTSGHHHPNSANVDVMQKEVKNTTHKSLHEILNITKGEMKVRDVGSAAAAAASEASAFGGSAVVPLPPPAVLPPFPAFGGYFPGVGAGTGAGLNLGIDAGFGGGAFAGILPFFPVIEKVIVIVGGGLLILIFLAIVQSSFLKGGLFKHFGNSFSKAFAGDVDFDLGPLHASNSAAGSVAFDHNDHHAGLTQRVMDGVNTRW